MSEPASVPGPTVSSDALADLGDQRPWPRRRPRRPPTPPCSAGRPSRRRRRRARRRRGRGRRRAGRRRGSWRRRAPARACRAPCRSRRRGARPASSRRTRRRRCRGASRMRVDRLLVAVHDREHALGQARLGEQLGQQQRRRGVLLGRLEHERVAARERDRRTSTAGPSTGKLNGVMPATTPSGWRSEYESTPVDTCGVVSPLSRCAEAAGELDDLEAARDLAARRRRAPCRARA